MELKFTPPLINASGVLSDHPYLLKVWEKAGVGGVLTKSIPLNKKMHNLFDYLQNPPQSLIIRGIDYTINSYGVPSEGSDWWVDTLNGIKKLSNGVILGNGSNPYCFNVPKGASLFTGSGDPNEYSQVQEKLMNWADWFEINISCPNTDKCIIAFNLESLETVLSSLDYAKPVSVKLPPFPLKGSYKKVVLGFDDVGQYYLKDKITVQVAEEVDTKALFNVLDLIQGYPGVKYVTSMNTYPVSYPILGPPIGGLSGNPIKDFALKQAWLINNYSNLKIFASGGVMNAEDVKDFLDIPNVDVVQLGSGLFQFDVPHLFVENILKCL